MSIDDISLSGSAYRALGSDDQAIFQRNLETRRSRFQAVARGIQEHANHLPESVRERLVIIGDRPGPSRPVDDKWHHTPFYSTKHCAGWLNALQIAEGTKEEDLVWLNSTDHLGFGLPKDMLVRLEPWGIILLGGNACRWFESTPKHEDWRIQFRFDHPQYWKRFRSKELYPLFREINELVEGRRRGLW